MKMLCAIAISMLAPPAFAQEAPSIIGAALNSGNIEASRRFYTEGLGMGIGHEIKKAQGREIILGFNNMHMQPGIIILSDGTSAKAKQITQGNGLSRIALRVPHIELLAAQLNRTGYAATPIREVAMGYRMMLVTDPDSYRYELVESRGAKKDYSNDGK